MAAAAPAAELSPEIRRTTLVSGVLIMSFASLMLELALTRLFSVVLFYHFAFLAISVALLGMGAGGVFAYIGRDWLARWDIRTLGSRLAAANAVLLLLVLEVDLRVPVSISFTVIGLSRLAIMYVASAVPFFVTGLLFSVIFARQTRGITELYGADLIGGALACLGIIPVLNFLGGPNALLVAGVASAVVSVIWAPTTNSRRLAIALAVLLSALTLLNNSGALIDIVYAKGIRRDNSWVLFSRWNALSRVEVDKMAGMQLIVIDADAATEIMHTDPHNWGAEWKRTLMSNAPAVVNVLRPSGDYAIIGPGGGVDVLRAVANGSRNVTGIEINPIIVNDIMRGRWADYSYQLYRQPEVHIHVGEGRAWVRSTHEKFDVVEMTLVDTWASTAAGAFALSENNLYTVEAFREYFDHLNPNGIVAITRWEFREPREALRVVSQEIAALRQLGITDFRRHFMVVAEGDLNNDGRPVAVLAKRTPFTWEEERTLLDYIRTVPNLYPVYTPSVYTSETGSASPDAQAYKALAADRHVPVQSSKPFDDFINAGSAGRSATSQAAFIDDYRFDISPVFDSSPFFFFTLKSQDVVDRLLHRTDRAGIDWKNNLGVVVLGVVLVTSFVCILLFLILPLMFYRPARRHAGIRLLFFIAIGLGYILVEVAFIQRFVLFLGHPTYALTVVIFLLMLSSGAGSLLSRRWLIDPLRVRVPLTVAIVLLLAYVFAIPPVLSSLVGLPLAVKLLISAAALVPLGVAMGMPFPSGLRALAASAAHDSNTIEWAWALNASATVLGSVLAMVIAVRFGLSTTLATGVAAYLLALLLVPTLRRKLIV